MAEFISENLTGARFEDVYLTSARFHDVDLRNARFSLVDLTGVSIRGALVDGAEISGEVVSLRVNGVDVVPLVEAELNRRYPDRARMRPADAAGYREAWASLERLWPQTVQRARGLESGVAAPPGGRRVVIHRDAASPGVRDRRLGAPRDARRPVALGPAGPAPRRDARRAQRPARSHRAAVAG